jgi:ornithine carbamoyltransferase
LEGKDLLTLEEVTPKEIDSLLKASLRMKSARKKGPRPILKSKSMALIFQKPSTRTRLSFQVAMHELGGASFSLSSSELQLGRGETIEDTARVLSRYVDLIMARVISHQDIVRLGDASSKPVINGLSDLYHPVQILADLLTLLEHKGKLKGLNVSWVGDGNNVCNSWMYGAALSGINFRIATPVGYEPLKSVVAKSSWMAKLTGGSITLTNDPEEAVREADCVMTDTFVSMGFDEEREKRLRAFMPRYSVTEKLMSKAKRNAIFEHCLPAHRGEEVSAGVIDGPHSVVWDEAENRLHTTKALLAFLLLGRTFTSLV